MITVRNLSVFLMFILAGVTETTAAKTGAMALPAQAERAEMDTADANTSELPKLIASQGSTAAVTELLFSPDGRQLLTSGGVAIVWDVATGSELARLFEHDEEFPSFSFSGDGKRIFTVDKNGRPIVWEWTVGRVYRPFSDAGSSKELSYCQSEGLLFAIAENAIVAWSTDDGSIVGRFDDHPQELNYLTVNQDCSIVLGASSSGEITEWRVEDSKIVRNWVTPRTISSLSYSHAGDRLVIGHDSGWITVWSMAFRRELIALARNHSWVVASVQFSADDQLVVSGGEDGHAIVWDYNKGTVLADVTDNSAAASDFVPRFRDADFSPSNRSIFATAGYGRYAILWNIETGKEVYRFDAEVNYVRSLMVDRDFRRVAVGNWDHSVSLWNLSTGILERKLLGHSGEVISVSMAPDGKTIISGGADKSAILWSAEDGRELARLQTRGYVESSAFLPVGETALIGTYDDVLIWNFKANRIVGTLNVGRGPIPSLGVTDDGKTAITGSTEGKLWNLETGHSTLVLGASDFERYAIGPSAISRSGKLAVTANGLGLNGNYISIVWNAVTGDRIAWLEGISQITAISQEELDNEYGHKSYILAVAISSSEKYLITGDANGVAIIWEISSARPIKHLLVDSA